MVVGVPVAPGAVPLLPFGTGPLVPEGIVASVVPVTTVLAEAEAEADADADPVAEAELTEAEDDGLKMSHLIAASWTGLVAIRAGILKVNCAEPGTLPSLSLKAWQVNWETSTPSALVIWRPQTASSSGGLVSY